MSMNRIESFCIIALHAVVAIYAVFVPYTKVEESFNVQAIHDILYYGLDVSKYDHLEFPGVVPRTFIGALAIATPTVLAKFVAEIMGLPKLFVLKFARMVLGFTAVNSIVFLKKAVDKEMGNGVGAAFLLITMLQFHLPYYMSRPLPNSLALVVTNYALAHWIHPKSSKSIGLTIFLLAFAVVVLRCDVLLLAGLVGLHLLFSKKISFIQGITTGIGSVIVSLILTTGVDSFFWRGLIWPEGHVLWFNTALNKSHEWGTAPFFWYFTSALPRALHMAFVLAPIGIVYNAKIRPIFVIALGYVILYSNLPHKEVRFLFPVLPLWNICAAAGLTGLLSKQSNIFPYGTCKTKTSSKSAVEMKREPISLFFGLITMATVAAGLLAGVVLTVTSLVASRANYPGGAALSKLHSLGSDFANQASLNNESIHVHIGVLPAMTGVSRFGELGPPWVYSKTEDIDANWLLENSIDFALSANETIEGFNVMQSIDGYSRLEISSKSPLEMLRLVLRGKSPLQMVTTPQVYIHRKR